MRGSHTDSAAPASEAGRNALELLRVAAIGLLVLYHVACLPHPPPLGILSKLFLLVARAGFIGTDLLLALAGFLAVGSRGRASGAGAWLVRRWWRVFPPLAIFMLGYLYFLPYLLAALGVAPASLPNFVDLSRARAVQWTMWLFTSNFLMVAGQRMGAALEPLLTLGLGAQLTILIAFLLPSSRRVYLGTGIVVSLGFVLRLYWVKSDAYIPYSFPLTRGDGFLLGATFALLLRSQAAKDRLLALRSRLLVASTILLAALVVATKGLLLTSTAMKTFGYPTVSLWSATLVLWFSQISHCPSALRLLSLLGQGTFCAYLVKLPVCYLVSVFLLHVRMPGIPLFALCSFGATALLGMAGYLFVERPFARIGILSRWARPTP